MIEVYLENIRSISSLHCILSPGVNIVVGPNGSGKTTLCNALYLAFYGRTLWGTRSHSNIVKRGESTGKVKVTLPLDDRDVSIERMFGKNSYVRVFVDNIPVTPQVDPESIVHPDVMKFIYFSDLKKINIMEYLDIDSFTQHTKTCYKELDTQRLKLKEELSKVETEISLTEKLRDNAQLEVEKLKRELSNISSRVNTLRTQLRIKDFEELSRLRQKLEQCKLEVQNRVNSMKMILQNELHEHSSLLNDKKKLLEQLELKYSKELKEITGELTQQLLQLELQERKELDKQLSPITVEISSKVSQIQKLQKVLDEVEKTGASTCPLCGSPVDESHIKKEIETLRSEVEKLEQRKQDIERDIRTRYSEYKQMLQKDAKEREQHVVDEYEKKRELLLKEMSTIEEQIKKINKQLSSEPQNINEIILQVKKEILGENYLWVNTKALEEQEKLLLELQNLLQTETLKHETVEKLEQDIAKYSEKINQLTRQIEELKQKAQKVETGVVILEKLTNTRSIKKHISRKIFSIVCDIVDEICENYPLKLSPELKEVGSEGYELIFLSTNLHGDVVPIEELSAGESVLTKIAANFVVREFVRRVKGNHYLPKLLIIDEVLDRLDSENALQILEYLSGMQDYTFVIVTHRLDLVESLSNANIIELQR